MSREGDSSVNSRKFISNKKSGSRTKYLKTKSSVTKNFLNGA